MLAYLVDPCSDLFAFVASIAREVVICHFIRGDNCFCIFFFLFSVGWNTYFVKVFPEQGFQNLVWNGVGTSINKAFLYAGFCHQGSTFCDFVYPFFQCQCVFCKLGANHVQYLSVWLNYVWRVAACISDSVVDSCTVWHVFTQELYTNIHQFHSVQRGTSQFRCTGCMGSYAGKFIFYLNAGVAGSRSNLINTAWMPGQSGIQFFPDTVTCHKCFGCAAFFTRTTIEDNGSGMAVFQIFFDSESSCHSASAQHIVTAAMTTTVWNQFLAFGSSADLRKTGQSIIFSQNSDHWLTAAVDCLKSSFDAGNRCFYFESGIL